MENNTVSAKEQHEIYTSNNLTEGFSEARFIEAWNRFLVSVNSPNLKMTLSSVPEYNPAYNFVLKIENTVQEENIRNIKPQLVTFLRRELKNSSIEVSTEIVENKSARLIYSDDEKYQEMTKSNPDLAVLRQKFNLDFGD